MKRKVAASVKRSGSKPKKTQPVRNAKTMATKKSSTPKTPPSFQPDPGFAQAVQNYEAAIKAIQEHKFDKAKVLLEKLIATAQRELTDRAPVHLSMCNQHLASNTTSFNSQ